MSHRKSVRAIIINGDKLLTMKRNKFGSEYYMLIGGGIKLGETLESAMHREISEETGLTVGGMRLVFYENDPDFYGEQYVFLCEYTGGEPVLSQRSDEAQISAMGQNIYQPVWLPLSQLSQVPFRSASLAEAILDAMHNGFPNELRELAWKPENVSK